MGKLFNIILLFVSLSFFINQSNAQLGTVNSILLDNSTDNSLEISWSDIPGAFGYYVYYSKTPMVNGFYNEPTTEFIEKSKYTISGLKKATKYYISIKVVDNKANEGDFSEETHFITKGNSFGLSTFGLKSVKIEKLNKLLLVFSSPLEKTNNAIRSFKITKKNDSFNLISVINTELINPKELVLHLKNDLTIGDKYNLTVISIKSVTGENIESGVNGLFSFIVDESFRPVVEPEVISKTPVCLGIRLGDLKGDAPFETNVSCKGNNVDTFKIECGNGIVLTKASDGLTKYTGKCNYSSAGVYDVKCYINNDIINDSCKKTITINKPINIKPTLIKTKVEQYGPTINNNIYTNNTKVVASKETELVKTGPENLLVLLFSLLLGVFAMFGLKLGKK